ncbi:MAG: MBL fold metallo-hydrolase [Candidatus Hadarchaeum sp.]|uniref:MBL fold metallo-hydrolase n=1 Tax=Candidatus Hadarchaeum sp. TaxID=2883567 RepID=UPI00317AF9DD
MSTELAQKGDAARRRFFKPMIAVLMVVVILLVTAPSIAQAKSKSTAAVKVYQERDGVTRFEEYTPLSSQLGVPPGFFYKANVYAVNFKGGIVLIDCGAEDLYSDLMVAINKKLPSRPILAVLLTHGHADHAGAGHYFIDAGIPVYASFADSYLIQMGMNFPGVPIDFTYTGYTPTQLLYGGEHLFGLNVIPTPGHTYGCLSFLEVETKLLFSGDVTISYPGDDVAPEDMTFELEYMTLQATDDTSLEMQLNSLNLLLELTGDRQVKAIMPGHNQTYYGKHVVDYLKNSIEMVSQELAN